LATRDLQPFTLLDKETLLEIEAMLQPLNPWHTLVQGNMEQISSLLITQGMEKDYWQHIRVDKPLNARNIHLTIHDNPLSYLVIVFELQFKAFKTRLVWLNNIGTHSKSNTITTCSPSFTLQKLTIVSNEQHFPKFQYQPLTHPWLPMTTSTNKAPTNEPPWQTQIPMVMNLPSSKPKY